MVDLLQFTSNKKILSGVVAFRYKVYCQTLSQKIRPKNCDPSLK